LSIAGERVMRLDLHGLRLRTGGRYECSCAITVEPVVLGGAEYQVVLSAGPSLTVDRVAGGFVIGLSLDGKAYGPCARCLQEVVIPCHAEQQEFAPTSDGERLCEGVGGGRGRFGQRGDRACSSHSGSLFGHLQGTLSRMWRGSEQRTVWLWGLKYAGRWGTNTGFCSCDERGGRWLFRRERPRARAGTRVELSTLRLLQVWRSARSVTLQNFPTAYAPIAGCTRIGRSS
jgi:hypothetical protein